MHLYAREEQDSVSYIYSVQHKEERRAVKKKKKRTSYLSIPKTNNNNNDNSSNYDNYDEKKKNRRKPQFSEETKIGHFGQSCEYTKVRLKSHLQDSKKKKENGLSRPFFEHNGLNYHQKKKKEKDHP